ncbi:MAG: cell division protein MukB [Clostridiales bacterium]|nr:cell division protein MukB [Clostridiales bacterium]
MKSLKKILLVNWLYFSRQLIEVGDINFLTGKNGAGKSTVIDALQIVLLGETNVRNFNQAANEKSQRTLDGYLRADMDDNNPYSRRGKDFSSYIACEFWDDIEGTRFVTGIVFDCRSDSSRQERFFLYDGVIPENCFIERDEAIDIPTLRTFLKQQYGTRAKLYDSQKQYRTDMLAKWNVHNEQVTRMMKKAVSFRPIVDIQKFITENICDIPERPDIEAMQQNIRDYKRHEQLAQRQEEKLAALQEIGRLYREAQQAIDRWQQHSFLVLWAQKEDLDGEYNRLTLERQDCALGIEKEAAEFDAVAARIDEKERRRTELRIACAQSDVSREEDRLRSSKERLLQEQQTLLTGLQKDALEIRREAELLCNLCCTVLDWPDCEEVKAVQAAACAVEQAYAAFAGCDYQIFAQPLDLFERAQQAAADFSAAVRDAAYQIKVLMDDLRGELDQKTTALANLRKNIKDYPRGLLRLKARLASELEKDIGHPVQIDILADVLEIPASEELWRRAVEGYLNTQKFYLLIDPACYQDALQIYDRIKREFNDYSFGLVDVGKLREKEPIAPCDDSLAKKIETDHALARSYIDYLLGRVVCCTDVKQLRKHRTAITSDGMVYQGYVARPLRRELMEDAFIGRRAVALRITRLESELTGLQAELQRWQPVYKTLSAQQNHADLFSRYFVQSIVTQRQTDYLRGMTISRELEQVETQLSALDLFWLEEQKRKIQQMGDEIDALKKAMLHHSNEKTRLEERASQLDREILPNLQQRLSSQNERISEDFTPEFIEGTGIPRYCQELKRLTKPAIVYRNFSDRLNQTTREREISWQKLLLARRNYVDQFRPCSFQCDGMDNEEFEAERKLLEESELPRYRAKIKAARESAMEQLQNDFLAKLKSSIDQVLDQVKSLNKALKQAQFGTDSYLFRVDRNPDYGEYYDMIMAPELMEGDVGLFALPFQQKYGKLMEDLFSRIAMSDDTQVNARKQSELQQNIARFTDFRTYLKFDLETTDQNGSKQLLSQTLNTKSGGETQTPFYIAVLASFAQLYQVNNLSGLANNTVRLVVFDEAFNKMDSERIVESVRLLRKMGLQAIICTPPDKLPDIMPLTDRTLLVAKDGYQMYILPYSKENAHV